MAMHYHPVDLVIVQGDTRVCQRCDKTWNFMDAQIPYCVAPPSPDGSDVDDSVDAVDEDFSLDVPEDGGFGPPKFTPEEQRERTKKLLKWVLENYDRTKAKEFFPNSRQCVADFTLEDDIACQQAIMATYLVCIDPVSNNVVTQQYMNAIKYPGANTPEEAMRASTFHPDLARSTTLPDMNPKTRMGALKVPLHLVPPSVMHALALTFEDGANKYGAFNWRSEQVSASVYYGALMRHMFAWFDGEDFAEDSGRLHLHHAMACLAILIDADSIMMLNDDRPEKGASSVLQKIYLEKKK